MKGNRSGLFGTGTEDELRHALTILREDYAQLLDVADFWYQKAVALQIHIKELETNLAERKQVNR